MNTSLWRNRLIRVAMWFLAVSYGIGGPLTAVLEFQKDLISERFDLPPLLIYLTCVAQTVCAILVFMPRLALWATGTLTVITIGAIGSHIRIGSPETAVTAVIYTAVQVWFGLKVRSGAGQDQMI